MPFNGVPAIYNFLGFLPDRHFWWLASILFPANLAAFVSHLPPADHAAIMRRYHYTSSVTITTRDNPERSRVTMDRGRATLDFRESRRDVEILRDSLLHAARGFLGVGARRVFMPLLRPPQHRLRAGRGRLRASSARLRRSPVVLGSHERGNADGTRQPARRHERRRPAVRYRQRLRGRLEPLSVFVRRQPVVDDHGAQPPRGQPPRGRAGLKARRQKQA